mmetsp:Transcript_14212/g.40560  ORF Transcript_14212/g.40560 Transcript_14212/m.40560 type:complete len:203 (-) Transcript_14212:531-1139(-)
MSIQRETVSAGEHLTMGVAYVYTKSSFEDGLRSTPIACAVLPRDMRSSTSAGASPLACAYARRSCVLPYASSSDMVVRGSKQSAYLVTKLDTGPASGSLVSSHPTRALPSSTSSKSSSSNHVDTTVRSTASLELNVLNFDSRRARIGPFDRDPSPVMPAGPSSPRNRAAISSKEGNGDVSLPNSPAESTNRPSLNACSACRT